MRWVSIKILTADATTDAGELGILRSLAKLCKGSLGSKCIVQLLDEFSHQGPNGTHQCLVFELLGPTVDMVTSDYYSVYSDPEESLEPDIVLKISEQLLKAIAFMHEAGYVHGGRISYEMLAVLQSIILLLFSAADLQQILVAGTLPLRAATCPRQPEKTFSTSLEAQSQRS